MSWEIKTTSVGEKQTYLEVNPPKICTKFILKDIITKAAIEYYFRKIQVKTLEDFFEKYFENLLTPTPEELTLVDIEFEEWFCNEYLLGGGVVNYGCRTTYIAWNAWQASRKAMKPIKLPVKMKNTEAAECYYYNDAIDECKEAIEQAGHEVEE